VSDILAAVSFHWDDAKRESNIQRHGLDFVDAWEVFLAPMLTDSTPEPTMAKIEPLVSDSCATWSS
jgi:uncharacterized DUF497 family protein